MRAHSRCSTQQQLLVLLQPFLVFLSAEEFVLLGEKVREDHWRFYGIGTKAVEARRKRKLKGRRKEEEGGKNKYYGQEDRGYY